MHNVFELSNASKARAALAVAPGAKAATLERLALQYSGTPTGADMASRARYYRDVEASEAAIDIAVSAIQA